MIFQPFKNLLLVGVVFCGVMLCVATPLKAQVNEEILKQQEDARLYLEMIDILKDANFDDQIAGWEKFLKDHPNSYFRDEIQSNRDSMKARRSIEDKAREEEDSRLYFRTVEKAASLPMAEQVALWERYLKESPESLFANEARTTMNRLKEEQRWSGGEVQDKKALPANLSPNISTPTPTAPPTVTPVPLTAAPKPIAKAAPKVDELAPGPGEREYLDPQRALFLAVLPGIVVPGLGHFYAKRYAMGGFLAAVRITGLGLLGVGAYRSQTPLIVPGAAMALLSYALDVLMAPIEARDYNYSLEPLPPLEENKIPESSFLQQPNSIDDAPLLAFTIRLPF